MLGAAVHEAGHCVVGLALGFRLDRVWINDEGGGLTRWFPEKDAAPVTSPAFDDTKAERKRIDSRATRVADLREDPARFDRVLEEIRRLFNSEARIADFIVQSRAGRFAAEKVEPGDRAIHGASDDEIGIDLLLSTFSSPRKMAICDHRSRWMAQHLVEKHWLEIVTVASHLLLRHRLEGHEVVALLTEHRTLKPETVAA